VGLNARKTWQVYMTLNAEIERQLELDPNNVTDEGTELATEYIDLVIIITLSALVGPLFPLSYMLSWSIIAFEFEIDQQSYIHFKRRPDPVTEGDIGYWSKVLYA